MNKYAACMKLNWPNYKGDRALRIFDEEGVQFGSFQLKNPDLSPSPIYFNLRIPKDGGWLTQCTIDMVAIDLFLALDNTPRDGLIAGIPKAGVPIAAAYYNFMNRVRVPNRFLKLANFEKKENNGERRIAVFCSSVHGRVLVIDDVISSADTMLEAAKAVEEAGCTVSAFAVYIDREQGGKERLEARGYKIVSVYKISELLEFYMNLDLITQEKYNEVMRYIERTKKIIAQ